MTTLLPLAREIIAVTPSLPKTTRADVLMNDFLLAFLHKKFPKNFIFSEESPDNARRRKARRLFIIDPLDGSGRFRMGRDDYAVNIALVDRGRPLVGVVILPALSTFVFAVRGKGAYCEKRGKRSRIHVSARRLPSLRMTFSESSQSSVHFRAICRALSPRVFDRRGSAGFKLAQIALGNRDVYIRMGTPCAEWDIAAGDCVLHEAGGTLTDFFGHRLRYNQPRVVENNFIASNGVVHEGLLDSIHEVTA